MGSRAQPKDSSVIEEEDDNEEEEEERFMNADSIAAFAKPLQRKEKKDMELRSWKDMLDPTSTYSRPESRKANKVTMIPPSVASAADAATTPMDVDNGNILLAKKSESLSTTRFDMPSDQREIVSEKPTFIINQGSEERISFNSSPPLPVAFSSSNGLGTRQASSSLESEIDVENHARLLTMSPEEIAEAQAELLEKMDPALLSILKKRGQDKAKKRKHSVPEVSNANEETKNLRTEGHFFRPDIHSRHGQAATPSASEPITIPKERNVVQNPVLAQGFLWDAWTERVEAARDLRFSFDGNVVEDDVVPAAETSE